MKIGILGAGQLGRMLAISGYKLGHKFGFYGNSNNEPASMLGAMFVAENNANAIKELVSFADVVSFESENTDIGLVRKINKSINILPAEKSLFIAQHRGREKELFNKLNIPCTPYKVVNSLPELESAVRSIGLPVIVKTTINGYDGRGQFVIKNKEQILKAKQYIDNKHLIVEGLVNFKRELSLIAVRGTDKSYKCYPLVENIHHNGILRLTIAPAQNVPATIQKAAEKYMQMLLDYMDHVGVFTIEFFETDNGLLVNEIAPRVHNSGHWSIEAARTSQFENHIRAITNMPLGDVSLTCSCSAMINIIGKVGAIDTVLKMQNASLHLYDKKEYKNRKLGHITIVANSIKELNSSIRQLKKFLPDGV